MCLETHRVDPEESLSVAAPCAVEMHLAMLYLFLVTSSVARLVRIET